MKPFLTCASLLLLLAIAVAPSRPSYDPFQSSKGVCLTSLLTPNLNKVPSPAVNGISVRKYLVILLLGLSGDCELNPGPECHPPTEPVTATVYPCGVCEGEVDWEDRGLVCDSCETWFHIGCQGMSPTMYSWFNKTANQNVSWICLRCGLPNFSSWIFDSLNSTPTRNRFSSLSESDCTLSPLPYDIGPPTAASSPISAQPRDQGKKKGKAQLHHPLRILVMNCQSIKNKKAELHTVLDTTKADIILGTESWLSPKISNAEIFPDDYDAIRKDRPDEHGGVFVAFKRDLLCVEVAELDSDCELVWCRLEVAGARSLYLCSFYRPPNKVNTEYLDQLNTSLRRIMTNKNANILLGGDFNCGNIDWDNLTVQPGAHQSNVHVQLVNIVKEHCLSQVVNLPTRNNRTLDLLLTNNPGPVTRVKSLPPIGKSDHDIVFVEYDIKSKRIRQPPRKIFLYKKADMPGLKEYLGKYRDQVLSGSEVRPVEEIWNDFKSHVLSGIDKFIPSKMSKSKVGYPWINSDIRKLIRKRDRLFKRARKSNDPHIFDRFKDMRSQVQKVIRDAHYKYVNSIFEDCETPTEGNQKCPKKFWSYINNLKSGSKGITSLRDNGILKTSNKDKADILNKQFFSVFTNEHDPNFPDMGSCDYQPMPDIHVDSNGVLKLLRNLNPNKASGPDGINARVLKECAGELAGILSFVFEQSLTTGEVPSDWRNASVAPVFKKGDKYNPVNYRPISLTCISCKVLEHIIVSNIMRHVSRNNILSDIQHGFRESRSCETQLVQFVHDLASNLDCSKSQTDVLIMDFAKAFDKVPHKRLAHKLHHYGVQGTTLKWVQAWLHGRSQSVVLEGAESDPAPVVSGVPQGSVLGPVLFLLFINDLPNKISSSVRLFADDCVLYRNISSLSDCHILQNDLNILQQWEQSWLMQFNVAKCEVMRISRSRQANQIKHDYLLHDQVLDSVNSSKYLGVTLTNNLDWSKHIDSVSSKATKTLGFLRRNLCYAPLETRLTAYKTLVRPQVEYASPIWNPHTQQGIQRVEKVQRTAARWACRRWRKSSHVGDMLGDLNLDSLEHRRHIASLVFFYKIHYNLVIIDKDKYLTPATRMSLRTRHSHSSQYLRPTPKTDCFKYSFFPRLIPIWNGLPESTVSFSSVDSFKQTIASM